jgi:hypothetical protein
MYVYINIVPNTVTDVLILYLLLILGVPELLDPDEFWIRGIGRIVLVAQFLGHKVYGRNIAVYSLI